MNFWFEYSLESRLGWVVRGLIIAALAFFAGRCSAIDLPDDVRVSNRGPMCAWASLETLANLHGVDQLKGLRDYRFTKRRNEPAYDVAIKAELDRRGVNYKLLKHGSYDRSLLHHADDLGVVVALNANTGWSIYMHAVLLTKYDADKSGTVEFYCSDKRQSGGVKGTWKAPRSWFDRAWSGGSIVIYPEAEAAE